MTKMITILLSACVFICAAAVALPVLLVLALVGTILLALFAGSGFLALAVLAIVVIVPIAILLHIFMPLLLPLLLICGILYFVKHHSNSVA